MKELEEDLKKILINAQIGYPGALLKALMEVFKKHFKKDPKISE